jgi:hypothetical protein
VPVAGSVEQHAIALVIAGTVRRHAGRDAVALASGRIGAIEVARIGNDRERISLRGILRRFGHRMKQPIVGSAVTL